MRGISWFVDILRDRSKLLRLKLTNLFPNINFSGEKDSGKVLIIIIILFLIIIIIIVIIIIMFSRNVCWESLGPRPNHGPGALKGSQLLA